MSGRREPQVLEAARLMGQTSYIYEAGCAFAIDGETTLMTGEMVPDENGNGLRADRGSRGPEAALRALRRAARVPLALARRPRPLPPLPRQGRRRRGQRPARRATGPTTCGCSTTARSAGRWRRSRGAPTPTTWCRRWSARRTPSPPTPAPAATTRRSASGSATRSRTSRSPRRSAASSSSPTGPSATPACAPRSRGWDNVTVTEGSMGDGFYEAVVSTLVERRCP